MAGLETGETIARTSARFDMRAEASMNGEHGTPRMAGATANLGPCARDGAEGKTHDMAARRHGDGAEQNVGAQDLRRLAVDLGEPPGVPEIVEHDPAAVGAVGLHDHLGVAVADDARAGRARAASRGGRRMFEQHGGAQVRRRARCRRCSMRSKSALLRLGGEQHAIQGVPGSRRCSRPPCGQRAADRRPSARGRWSRSARRWR